MVVLIVNRTERVYDFSYENLHFISRNVKPTRKSRSSPSPSPLRLSFSLISTFFCRSSGGFYRLPSPPLSLLYNTQERSRNSLKIILRNDNRILHASKKKKKKWNTYVVLIRAAVIVTFAKKISLAFRFRSELFIP